MKISRISLALFGTIFFTASNFAQALSPARLKINNRVGLDSTYSQVIRVFGKPTKDTKPQREECIGGREKTVEYPGITFYLMDGPSRGRKVFLVMSFEVTSPKFAVSGIKIGDVEAVVRRRLGRRYTLNNDISTGQTTWHYEIGERNGPGWTTVAFKDGRVTRISSSFTVC